MDTLLKEKKAVGSHIVFKEKLNRHNQQIKFKAKIVTKGFSQVSRKDFTKTFLLVAKFTTLQVHYSLYFSCYFCLSWLRNLLS